VLKKAAVFLLVLIMFSSLSPAMGDERPPVEVWLGWGIYPGWGLAPGWGHGQGLMGIPYQWYPQCMDFLDDTKELRRELVLKQFEYFEAARMPEVDTEEVIRLEGEIAELRDKILKKAPLECGGYQY
jgi:hypothetical protein